MKHPKFLVFCLLLLSASLSLRGQSTVPDCEDIHVDIETTAPTIGQANGSINLTFTKPIGDYKIFFLNAGEDKTGKEEVLDGRLKNLKAGFFDFLIMDKNKKGCIKQLTVVLK